MTPESKQLAAVIATAVATAMADKSASLARQAAARELRQKSATPQRPFSGAPAAGFGLDSDHFCASFEAIWVIKDLGFGLISTRAFRWCAGLVLNRKKQIFINFLTPEGRAQKQGRAVTKSPESSCRRVVSGY